MGLARAYVTGLRRAWRIGRARPSPARVTPRQRVKAAALAARLGAIGPPPKRPASEARLTGRLHTRGRDRTAIAHHDDLSNEFYELLLDEHMAYSSAFSAATASLCRTRRPRSWT